MLALTFGLQAAGKPVKGNGRVETRIIRISDYDEITIAGSMSFEYEQSGAEPFLSITMDENLFDYITAGVEDEKLRIGPKRENEFSDNSYNLNPTVFRVKSNSRELKKLVKAGSGDFVVKSPLKIGRLNIQSAGSGSVRLRQSVTGDELDMSLSGSGDLETDGPVKVGHMKTSLSGSGDVRLKELISGSELRLSLSGSGKIHAVGIDVAALHCNLASSGGVELEGKAQEASYNLAGSGHIKAYGCRASSVKANLSGSGSIEVDASEAALNVNTVGSGSIFYKGKPLSVKESKMGSGSIRQVQ